MESHNYIISFHLIIMELISSWIRFHYESVFIMDLFSSWICFHYGIDFIMDLISSWIRFHYGLLLHGLTVWVLLFDFIRGYCLSDTGFR